MILGKTGTGKTVLAKSLIENSKRLLVLDPLGEYGGRVFFDFDALADFFMHEPEEFQAVLRPQEEEDADFFFQLPRRNV